MSGAAKLTFAIKAVNEASAVLREVRSDIAAMQVTAEESSGRLSALGGALSGLGNSMMTVGKVAGAAMAGGLAAAGAGLASALKASGDFERGLNVVASVAQATGAELAELKRTALELGESTAFSASQVLQAMEVLAANGISTSDIINGAARAALDLAAAGSTSLPQAADTVSTAMAVWNLSTEQLTDTVNRLAGAANVSRFGVEDMSLAIAQGGGAASAAGVSFQDFSAAIAAIAPLFASGSDAGTSFKTFLQRLVPDTKSAHEAFLELGLITADGANKFFDASGKMKSMAEIAGILNESLNRLSDKDRTRLLSNAFGTDAMRTAIGLSRMTKEEFEALQRSMGEASAADIGAQRMRGFAGAMEQLQGAIETARIEIGDRLNPVATALAQRLAELVPVIKDQLLAAMDWFAREVVPRAQAALAELRAAWERIEEPVMRFLGSKEALNIGLGMLAAVLMSVAVAAGAAAAGMLAAVAPVAALGLAIGGILIVADRLGVDWGKVWDGIREAVSRAADWIVPRVQVFAEEVGSLFRRFSAYFDQELRPALERIAGWVQAAFDRILPIIRPVIEGIGKAIASMVENAVKFFANFLEALGRLVDVVVQLINGDWSAAWNSAKEFVRAAWDAIKALLLGATEWLHIPATELLGAGKKLLGALADGLTWAWDNHVKPFLRDLPGMVKDFFAGAGEWLLDIGRKIIDGLWTGLKQKWEDVSGWVGGLGDKIKSLKGPPEKDRVLLYQIGQMIMEGLANGMGEGWEKDVVERIKDIGRGLIRNYKDVAEQAQAAGIPDWRNLGEVLTQALADGLFDRFKKNKPLLEQMAKELVALAEDTAAKVANAAAPPKIGIPANAPAGGYGPGDEMPLPGDGESYELGADGRWYPKGKVPPDKQLVHSPPPPTGAHGKPLVWVESLKAWVESWMAPGLQGMSPAEWARSMTPQPWGGPPPLALPRRETVVVAVNIDGREVASAVASSSDAQSLAWGV